MADNNENHTRGYPCKVGGELIALGDKLFSDKQNWDQLCQELAYWFAPEKADFTNEITLGEEFADHLSDADTVRVARDLANLFNTMLRPADQDWFAVTVPDDEVKNDTEARRKLESMTRITRAAIYAADAKYTRANSEADIDFAVFGCSVKSVTNNKDNNGIFFKTWHLKDCAWMENDWGIVDHLHRKMKMTAGGIESKFGERNLPSAVKSALKRGDRNDKFDVRHVALPVDQYEPVMRKSFPKGTEFASVYLFEDGTVLKEEPETVFPYIVSRWRTVQGWSYGYSPAAMTALPDARLIQRMAVSIIEATEKATEPPLIATSEAIQGPIDVTAGGVTYVDAQYDERLGAPLVPLDLGKNPGVGQALMDRKVADLTSSFYLDKISLPDTRNRTATEVRILQQEFVRSTLPIFEPLENEVIAPELDLVVNRLIKLGAYGTAESFPEILQDMDTSFEFQNPLRDAREQQVVGKFEESMAIIGAMAQLDPGVVANVNVDRMFRDTFKVTANPDWLFTKEEADKIKQDEAQLQQQQQALQQLQQGAQVASEAVGVAQQLQQVTGGGGIQ